MSPTISIVICTCNRAEHLRQTLSAMAGVCVPDSMPTELIVVDNASTDDTAEVVRQCILPNMPVRYLHEPERGQCHARNAGIAAAQGKVILFTDDDVHPPQSWIAGMCWPILSGKADAVAGGVKIAPHLERNWMTLLHRHWLASTEGIDKDNPGRMVGANMAFSRTVLTKIAGFDVELGPGALGFGDETVFTWTLMTAGFKVASALDTAVVHHFSEQRLLRESFLSTAERHGRVDGYLMHHYFHSQNSCHRIRIAKNTVHLALLRVIRRKECSIQEGMPLWEIELVQKLYLNKQWALEHRRPRRYEERGFLKPGLL